MGHLHHSLAGSKQQKQMVITEALWHASPSFCAYIMHAILAWICTFYSVIIKRHSRKPRPCSNPYMVIIVLRSVLTHFDPMFLSSPPVSAYLVHQGAQINHKLKARHCIYHLIFRHLRTGFAPLIEWPVISCGKEEFWMKTYSAFSPFLV